MNSFSNLKVYHVSVKTSAMSAQVSSKRKESIALPMSCGRMPSDYGVSAGSAEFVSVFSFDGSAQIAGGRGDGGNNLCSWEPPGSEFPSRLPVLPAKRNREDRVRVVWTPYSQKSLSPRRS